MTQASRDRTEYVEISGTAAERAAFTNPKQAMEWYETDTDARYKYLSGTWVLVTLTGGAAPGYGGGGGGGGGAVTIANGADVSQGSKADTSATWYNATASVISTLKLIAAALLDIGTHTYTYDATFTNKIATDTWVFLGTSRVKTITYNSNGMPATISDWV